MGQAARPESPMVSIIMATFNAGEKVAITMESILAQGYGNYEIIVVDGGSTEDTIDVIRRYENRISWWTSEPDKGVYDAFNKGILGSRGEWLHFIGAGDRMAGGAVLNKMLDPPPQGKIVYGNVRWMGSGRIYDGRFSRYKLCQRNIGHQAIFYHRQLFNELGLYEMRFPVVADWVFNIKCFGTEGVNPEYRDVTVVDFETGGMSDRVRDHDFRAERYRLIRRHLGLSTYLAHRTYQLRRNIKALFGKRLPR